MNTINDTKLEYRKMKTKTNFHCIISRYATFRQYPIELFIHQNC